MKILLTSLLIIVIVSFGYLFLPKIVSLVLSQVIPEEIMASRISKAIDFQNPITRNYAVRLAALFPGEYNIGQICNIYEFLYKHWRYVSDPRGPDYFASASESINIGLIGNCDDFAITMAALIEAIGGASRVVIAYGPTGTHAYAEVFVGYDKTILQYLANRYRANIHYSKDNRGGIWLNLDWNAKHPGGPYFKANQRLIIYPNGRYERG